MEELSEKGYWIFVDCQILQERRVGGILEDQDKIIIFYSIGRVTLGYLLQYQNLEPARVCAVDARDMNVTIFAISNVDYSSKVWNKSSDAFETFWKS